MRFSYLTSNLIEDHHLFIKGEGIIHNSTAFCDFSLMTGFDYIGIDINSENGQIYGISGFFSIKNLKREAIIFPQYIVKGKVIVTDIDMIPGTGKDYDFVLPGKYDSLSKCLCLGDNNNIEKTVKITNDTYISLHDNRILAIYIKPLYL